MAMRKVGRNHRGTSSVYRWAPRNVARSARAPRNDGASAWAGVADLAPASPPHPTVLADTWWLDIVVVLAVGVAAWFYSSGCNRNTVVIGRVWLDHSVGENTHTKIPSGPTIKPDD